MVNSYGEVESVIECATAEGNTQRNGIEKYNKMGLAIHIITIIIVTAGVAGLQK